MERLSTIQSITNRALRIFLVTCLIAGLMPAIALADTTVGVQVEAPAQVNETVSLDDDVADGNATDDLDGGHKTEGADSEAPEDVTGVVPAPEQINSEVALGAETGSKPAQITTDVAVGAPSSTQAETLLVDGLTYLIDPEAKTATLTGWYGNAPTGDLSIPSQVTDGKIVFKVEFAGGGRF